LLYPIYMMSYGAVRFFIEGFRASSSTSIFHISHIWAAIAFCLGLSIYIEMKGKKTKNREDKKGRR
ncbi:MAG: prolipoprotein diacylglyceryl transferase, partial [Clostridiales bacterium]|nr:prolipoprotein diacylglyceryl transferase [Clostridiales bacterium]